MEDSSSMISGTSLSQRMWYKLNETSAGLLASRNQQSIKSDLSEYKSQDIIRINLNARGLCDTLNSYLSFNFNFVGNLVGGQSNFGIRGSLSKIFSRVRLLGFDGTVIEDISNIDTWYHHLVNNMYSKAYRNTKGSVEGLREPQVEPTASGNTVQTDGYVDSQGFASTEWALKMATESNYIIPLSYIPFFSTNKLLPLSNLGTMTLELTLTQAAVCAQWHLLAAAPGGNYANQVPEYRVKSVECVLDLIKPSDVVQATLNKLAQAGQITLPWSEIFINSVSGVAQGGSFQLSKPVYSVKSAFVLPRVTADLVNAGADSYKSVTADTVSQYNFLHASQMYPAKPLDTVPKYFVQTCRSFNHYNDLRYPHCYNLKEYQAGGFLASLEAERDPGQSSTTGLSTKNGNNLQLDVTFTTPNSQKTLTWICMYEKVCQVKADMSLTIME